MVETARHTVLVGRSCTDITATATLTVRGETLPDRAADREGFRAAGRDSEYGTVLSEDGPGDDAVTAGSAGAWLAFDRVDLGAGPPRLTVRAAAPAGGATIEVRLDEPLSGPLAAVLVVPATVGRTGWTEVTAPLTGATGTRDLYVVLDTVGTRISTVRFVP